MKSFAFHFLRTFCPDYLYEEIEGDLIQKYERDVKAFGERKAKRRLTWSVIRFFRPGIVLRNKFSIQLNQYGMISHFFKIFLRSFMKSRTYSFINIAGLAVGLACSILIILWVIDEVSFNNFHKDGERIYKVMVNGTNPDRDTDTWDYTSGRLAEGLKELPEVEQSCRVTFNTSILFSYKDQSIYEDGVYADPSIFKVFTFPIIEGDAAHPLSDNNSVAISQKAAVKYFKTESPIGKVIRLDNKYDAKVTAVFKDVPSNSALQFQFIIPYQVYSNTDAYNEEWGAWTGGRTYVKLHKASDTEAIHKKIHSIITKPRIWPRWGDNITLFLQPLAHWQLYGNFENGKQSGGRIQYVQAFSIVAFFILLIACINFMNLATARSLSRSKEVGVRKVVGAARGSLTSQFMGESVLISFLSLAFALLLVHLLIPTFNDLTGKRINIDYTNPLIVFSFIGITLFTGLLAGSYPAFFLSSLRAISVLKGNFSGLHGAGIRKSLVVFQFSLSVILIILSLGVHQQISYMRNKNLGFDKDNIFYINSTHSLRKSFESFRTEALADPSIRFVSQGAANPAQINNGVVLPDNAWPGQTKQDDAFFEWLHCDYDFLPATGFTFVAGRNFSRDVASDSNNFIVTEEAVKRMKLVNPIGQTIKVDKKGQIIGVVKDFHSSGLQQAIDPVIITMRPQNTAYLFVRYNTGQLETAMKHIKELYRKFEPDFPLEYNFMNEPFGLQYQNEIMISKLSACFTMIAIFISCLGLFGLASFTAERRSKEIGVRKVLGASVSQIVVMLCRDFALLIVIALSIGMPIAGWGMIKYLSGYKFHTDVNVYIFIVTALVMLMLALLTVSFQSARAALVNPVKSLKSE